MNGYGFRNPHELKKHAAASRQAPLCGVYAYNLQLVRRASDVTCKNCLRLLEKARGK